MTSLLCGWLQTAIDNAQSTAVMTAMVKGLPSVLKGAARVCNPGVACTTQGQLAVSPDGLVATVVGEPYWSKPEFSRLADEHSHAHALVTAYRRHDAGLLEYLHGAFTLVVLDPTAGRLFAAIDRIGQHPFYYATPATGIVFGSSADSVRAHPEVDSRLSEQGIFNYFYFHMLPSPGCIYAAQRKLPGGHYLDYRAGRSQVVKYWQPVFTETSSASIAALGEEMQAVILAAVRRLSPGVLVGSFLSGGLDSSTVAGMLARLHPGRVKTYSIGFDVPGYDEMAYARIASSHFKTEQHEYYLTPDDAVAMIPAIARTYDEPFGNSSALPVYACARLAKEDGLSRLLAGDGGDELFAGNERYAEQYIFESYRHIPGFLRQYVIEACLKGIPSLQNLALMRKALSYVDKVNTPLPDRLEAYNFLHRYAARDIFSADFLQAIDSDYPLTLLRDIYSAPIGASALNRMLYLDWHRTLHDNDLVKVNRMCQLAGIDVVYPLLDDEIVAFSCKLPSRLKLKGHRLRWFYKQAMRDFLPRQIIEKTKHGFGMPFGIWMRSHKPLQELAYDSLKRLERQHYFQTAFIERALAMHRDEHAAYYGELIWILMMLSQWLEQHHF
ncbi:MAG: asparagine synthase-related protein [Candidatus Competibacteraceae bacterium]